MYLNISQGGRKFMQNQAQRQIKASSVVCTVKTFYNRNIHWWRGVYAENKYDLMWLWRWPYV